MNRKSKNDQSPETALILSLRRDIQDAITILAELKSPSDRVQNAIYILENALVEDETLEQLMTSGDESVK